MLRRGRWKERVARLEASPAQPRNQALVGGRKKEISLLFVRRAS